MNFGFQTLAREGKCPAKKNITKFKQMPHNLFKFKILMNFIKTNSSNPKLRFNIRITANENKPQRNIRFEYPNDIWSILDGPYNMVLWVK